MSRRRHAPTWLLLVPMLSALASAGTQVKASAVPCDQRPLTFESPKLIDPAGYEPGIEIDSAGTVFLTAHKYSLIGEGPRLSSHLWRSTDGGTSFARMAGLQGANEKGFAFEGDLAVDAKDRLYFLDTWLADNHVSRYSERGSTLDFWRPVVPTPEADDRPWIAAHGDGYVYYLSNTMLTDLHGRLTIHRSTDAGQTFDPVGFRIPASGWGFIDADPNSSYVYAFVDSDELGSLTAWISPDRGQTWTSSYVSDYRYGRDVMGFPNVAVSPVDGSVYAIWSDLSARIFLARSTDHGGSWTVHDVSPFSGQFLFPWVTVGPTGDVGIVFSADPHAHEGPTWYVYGMVWRPAAGCAPGPAGADCSGPAMSYGRLWDQSTGGAWSQADFFQAEFDPDNRLHVPFTGPQDPDGVTSIRYTRQKTGPNLDGSRFCGIVGTP